ncbi:MAG TPA: cytochrome c [Polyangia bacterium]
MFFLFTLAFVVINRTADAAETVEAKRIFNQRCSACHTFGRGVKVGPDLKGVTQRRGRPWLLRFIRSSQSVIRGGDTTAQTLFAQFKQQRMPDWSDLSETQITGILDWFAGNGPEQKEPDERGAELATAADVEHARRLFDGSERLTYGGTACGACHVVEERGVRAGGTLGPELTDTYRRFGDRALTLFLKRPCTGRAPESESTHYLAPEESFAIKGYLRRVAIDDSEGENP